MIDPVQGGAAAQTTSACIRRVLTILVRAPLVLTVGLATAAEVKQAVDLFSYGSAVERFDA